MSGIFEHGCWTGVDGLPHRHDPALADALAALLPEGESVADLGCGDGAYVRRLRETNLDVDGYDGNPQTPQLTGGMCCVFDLAGDYELGDVCDTVLCLEVLEHIPVEYEGLAVLRVCQAARNRIIISWAHPGQGGLGHYNCRPLDYVRAVFAAHGFIANEPATAALRERATLSWFQSNLLVLEKETSA